MRKILVPVPDAALFRTVAFDARVVDQHLSGMLHEMARWFENLSSNSFFMLPPWFSSEMLKQAEKATKDKKAKAHMRAWATLREAQEKQRAAQDDAVAAGRRMEYEQHRLLRNHPRFESLKDKLFFFPDSAGCYWLPKDDAEIRAALKAVEPKPQKRQPYYIETHF